MDDCRAEGLVASLTAKLSQAEGEALDWRKHHDVLLSEKTAIEEELNMLKANLEDVSTQLRQDGEAYTGRVRGLNERAAELRDRCDAQELQIEALKEDVKTKEVVLLSACDLMRLVTMMIVVFTARDQSCEEGL